MTEQPQPSTPLVPSPDAADHSAESPLPRRQPGEPHPYMLQRNPPNLWILVFMTVGALATAVLVMVLTVLL
ncbi:MAG: hypothetical protein AB7P40_05210 [Chloroflexota bacterium]